MSDDSVSRKRDTPGEPRRRVPKSLAVIHADFCTGCEACIAVCPVDCIALLETGHRVRGIEAWCEVDLDRCIGCAHCVHAPRRKSDPYELKICPWDAIEMVPVAQLVETVRDLGGPPGYATLHQPRLLEAARRTADARAKQ